MSERMDNSKKAWLETLTSGVGICALNLILLGYLRDEETYVWDVLLLACGGIFQSFIFGHRFFNFEQKMFGLSHRAWAVVLGSSFNEIKDIPPLLKRIKDSVSVVYLVLGIIFFISVIYYFHHLFSPLAIFLSLAISSCFLMNLMWVPVFISSASVLFAYITNFESLSLSILVGGLLCSTELLFFHWIITRSKFVIMFQEMKKNLNWVDRSWILPTLQLCMIVTTVFAITPKPTKKPESSRGVKTLMTNKHVAPNGGNGEESLSGSPSIKMSKGQGEGVQQGSGMPAGNGRSSAEPSFGDGAAPKGGIRLGKEGDLPTGSSQTNNMGSKEETFRGDEDGGHAVEQSVESSGRNERVEIPPHHVDSMKPERKDEGGSPGKEALFEQLAESSPGSSLREDQQANNNNGTGMSSKESKDRPASNGSDSNFAEGKSAFEGDKEARNLTEEKPGSAQRERLEKTKPKSEPFRFKIPKLNKIKLIKIALAILGLFLLGYFLFKKNPGKNLDGKKTARNQSKKDLALIKDLQNRLNMLGRQGDFSSLEIVQAYNFLLIYFSQFGMGKNIDWTTDEYLRYLLQRLPSPVFSVFRDITSVFNLVFYGGKPIERSQSQNYFHNVRMLAELNLSAFEKNHTPS